VIAELKRTLDEETSEADEIAGKHEETIEELVKENAELTKQRDYFKSELALTVTNREIAHNLEHQQEILAYKHQVDVAVADKQHHELTYKQTVSDLTHQIESLTREMATVSLKYDHQITTLKHENDVSKKESELSNAAHAKKLDDLQHKLVLAAAAIEELSAGGKAGGKSNTGGAASLITSEMLLSGLKFPPNGGDKDLHSPRLAAVSPAKTPGKVSDLVCT
jgi:DNA uptake protein ComE-like DNA-binding protein